MAFVRHFFDHHKQMRFSLAALLEFFAMTAILAAFFSQVGISAAVFLMLMALALAIRCGRPALFLFAASLLAADGSSDARFEVVVSRLLTVHFLGAAIAVWYCVLRGKLRHYLNSPVS